LIVASCIANNAPTGIGGVGFRVNVGFRVGVGFRVNCLGINGVDFGVNCL